MGYNEETVKQILREYDLMRTKAENKRDKYVDGIYKRFPRLLQIRDEINRLGLDNAKKIMAEPEKSAEYNKIFNDGLKKLTDEKNGILKANNIPADFENPRYACPLCKDTGYVGNEKCGCFKKKLIERAYHDSNLTNSKEDQTFENFDLGFYSDEKKDSEASDREIMAEILSDCKKFCENFDIPASNLLMTGVPGLGKTFLSNCIANEILNKGRTVHYTRATALFSSYEDYRFGRKRNIEFDYDKTYNSDLLIIDDLGTENLTKTGLSFLFDLMNERIDRGKKMIINTNLNMNEMSKTYTSRITSRIYESFKILHFRGEDIRIKKLRS